MRCDPACTTKEELIRRIEAGEGTYIWSPGPEAVEHDGEAWIYGPPAWRAKVEIKSGQIVEVLF